MPRLNLGSMSKKKPKEEHKKSGRRPWRHFTEQEIIKMAEMWKSGHSQTYISKQFSTCQIVVSRVLKSAGIQKLEPRPWSPRGIQSPSWKGGRISMGVEGYVGVWMAPDHEFVSMRNRVGYVPEHRLVMAGSLGRSLKSTETVHHINGDVKDNRLENLQLRQGKHGKGTVMECSDCGSHNIKSVPIADPESVSEVENI